MIKRFLVWLFIIVGIIFLFLMGIFHEQVHVEIYKHYGIDSHIELFSHFPAMVTIGDKPCPTESCILAHNINESIGYTLAPFFCMVYLGFVFLIIQREEKDD